MIRSIADSSGTDRRTFGNKEPRSAAATDKICEKFQPLRARIHDQPVDKPGVSSENVSGTSIHNVILEEKPSKTKKQEGRRCSGRNLVDSKINDYGNIKTVCFYQLESRISGDICRICHMGSFPRAENSRATRRRQNQGVGGADSQTSTASYCAYLGPLISACKCRGTVALVHAVCLERWLTESGHTRCELCGYKYVTKRVPRHNIFRSIAIWFNTVIVTRQMLLDILYLVVTTPLAIFSCYICALALNMLLKNGIFEVPWMIITMLPTCLLTLIAYWGWIITLGRLHGRRWRRYWRNNFVIRLVPNNIAASEPEMSSPELMEESSIFRSSETEETTEIVDASNDSN
ncbi:E3 ubiquitin-protein ligase MARCHF2 [Halictus rubicundus]|uniref:E3 ubiquitin-protein ligase MARCHF2 n=1 Tax=Halictus rubicundus TaxID=77578 RepID=UPI004035643B